MAAVTPHPAEAGDTEPAEAPDVVEPDEPEPDEAQDAADAATPEQRSTAALEASLW